MTGNPARAVANPKHACESESVHRPDFFPSCRIRCLAPVDVKRKCRSRYTCSVKENARKSKTPAEDPAKPATKILAIDYGRTKIGLAMADVAARIAAPFATIARINRNEDMRRLRELVRDEKVKQIVVGLPLRLDGTQGEMANEVARFAERVRKQVGAPVHLVDERLSSWEAERILEEELGRRIRHPETHLRRKKTSYVADTKYTVDAVAAMVILREYLAQEHGTKEHG
jgi:putative holliday junction resolvase